jgi:hypothetical protein
MMGIMLPETCWASNKIFNKTHLLHLVGILFPHIIDDVRSKPHQTKEMFELQALQLLNIFRIGYIGYTNSGIFSVDMRDKKGAVLFCNVPQWTSSENSSL